MKKEEIFKIPKKDFSKYFFKNLLEIPDCPDIIYAKGEIPDSNSGYKILAIVGSRNHSTYSKQALEKIISEIKGHKIIILSGLALGLDAIAHKLALESGIKTIAIPGSGISETVMYPRTNLPLSREILSKGGCLLNEFKPDFKATPWSFPQRNRLVAGMADAVLIAEAGEKSGTLITSRLTLDYNKNMGVIPASIFSEYHKGSNMLLQKGAFPIFSGKDILEILNIKEEVKQETLLPQNLDSEEKELLEILKEPKSKKQIQEELNKNITQTNTLLSILELKGIIKESLGKYRKI